MTYSTIINALFDWCVWVLEVIAPRIGMTYNEINIYLFVILQPALILLGLFGIIYYRSKYQAALDRADLISALHSRSNVHTIRKTGT